MDVLNSVNVAAVQSTWAVIKSDINTFAPQFYVALLTAYPEYQAMFPTIANVPSGQLLNNAALITLSVNVVTKLSEIIDSLGNSGALNAKLVDLANQHKQRGTTRAHFDNMATVLVRFLAATLGSAFTPEAKQAWTSTMQGINTVIEASA
ncbi:hemoglobin-1-like [Daphnia pulicaria]|uniref:hemoglobin-1-like n=1 Tax=Daphnia pulicaria TaxID=35523 RepID=UPI001EEB6283|nr:hemoglobin-1-like [Daphnia pulicaria]XP_046638599.1 hemoglobin-1-like [Daphnia pulicaria]XP_046638600.1 hemoglobin-1-like [Daphnia pulicaria]XP_046638601.1 hemoglobin-1-like [Daphnia pulicaria]XP_046638602.1 hemoglobin-1-like [Daphnia pulicaria]